MQEINIYHIKSLVIVNRLISLVIQQFQKELQFIHPHIVGLKTIKATGNNIKEPLSEFIKIRIWAKEIKSSLSITHAKIGYALIQFQCSNGRQLPSKNQKTSTEMKIGKAQT